MFLMFSRVCRVSAAMPPSTILPVRGSMPFSPATKTKPFALIAWLYGPIGAAAFVVTINMTQPSPAGADASQPAHIHVGGCPGVGAVDVPLTNVIGGKSTTTVTNKRFTDILATPHAVNVHVSTADAGHYTA